MYSIDPIRLRLNPPLPQRRINPVSRISSFGSALEEKKKHNCIASLLGGTCDFLPENKTIA